ncbi:hypothetical protein PRK78_007465 [Emydomyces testavorans]|uniref:BTB domain-containing protein n=1 Tax=Emydomyces testavorans TaxID=2070801 RepID=A0AAF0DN98_9EURO|nr:hypothetical protein PRK78_007465 [Emydomyces testavorans]
MESLRARSLTDEARKFEGPIVEFHVGHPGASPTIFKVHWDIIVSSSMFFMKALQGKRSKAKRRVIRVPNDDPEAIRLYLNWLYSGSIFSKTEDDGLEDDEGIQTEYSLLAKGIVLSNKFQDVNFHDAIVDALVDRAASKTTSKCVRPKGDVIWYIYDNTSPNAEIRQLLVKIYCISKLSRLPIKATEEELSTLPKEFLASLALELFENMMYCDVCNKMDLGDTCEFHKHPSEDYERCQVRQQQRLLGL